MNLLFFLSLLFSFLATHHAMAVVFGDDDRVESQSEATAFWRQISKSVPALVPLNSLKKVEGGWQLNGPHLKTFARGPLCEDMSFRDQKVVANCSASLIANDIVLTAAHCFADTNERRCEDYAVVFDYAKKTGSDDHFFVPHDNVYFCKEILYSRFAKDFSEDLAYFKLDRKVKERRPIEIQKELPRVGDRLAMIGHPLGIFQKLSTNGFVTELFEENLTFRHNLDSFSVNSGSPIFNELTGQQSGVLVRGSGLNLSKREGQQCYDWAKSNGKDFNEANLLVDLPLLEEKDGR